MDLTDRLHDGIFKANLALDVLVDRSKVDSLCRADTDFVRVGASLATRTAALSVKIDGQLKLWALFRRPSKGRLA